MLINNGMSILFEYIVNRCWNFKMVVLILVILGVVDIFFKLIFFFWLSWFVYKKSYFGKWDDFVCL